MLISMMVDFPFWRAATQATNGDFQRPSGLNFERVFKDEFLPGHQLNRKLISEIDELKAPGR
jgi:hypothetical protein